MKLLFLPLNMLLVILLMILHRVRLFYFPWLVNISTNSYSVNVCRTKNSYIRSLRGNLIYSWVKRMKKGDNMIQKYFKNWKCPIFVTPNCGTYCNYITVILNVKYDKRSKFPHHELRLNYLRNSMISKKPL